MNEEALSVSESIVPTGALYLLHDVTLDNSYKNTFSQKMFSSLDAQANFFKTKMKTKVDKVTPVRLQNVIRVPLIADAIIDCNYMMWQNSASYTRWYYAFITQIDWISIHECNIHYEIDVIQTNLLYIGWHEAFVERQHMTPDTYAKNLYPDNIEKGEYVINGFYKSHNTDDMGIMIASIYDAAGSLVQGYQYAGVYSGVAYVYCQSVEVANDYIKRMNDDNKQDGIVAIYMCPKLAFDRDVVKSTIAIPKKFDNIDGYKARNMKAYTSPYNFLYVSNNQGQSATYQYEYFSTGNCMFDMYLECTPAMTFVLVPRNYKGVEENWNEKLTMQLNIPCTYNTDYYKAWLAQHNTEMGVKNLSMASSGLQLVGGLATGNPVVATIGGAGLVNGITDRAVSISQAQVHPAQFSGTTSSVVDYQLGLFEFSFYAMQIRQEFARTCDSVWDATGYPLNELVIPDTKSRPRYNYTKTSNACIFGNICLQHRKRIEQALNDGITWWHGDWIGDYKTGNYTV